MQFTWNINLTFWQNCPAKHQRGDYIETATILAGCDHAALVKSPADMALGALSKLAGMGADKLSKTLTKVKTNSKEIEAAMPKDLLDKLSKAVPKGTKVESINDSDLKKDLSSSNDPMALAKKLNINTDIFSSLGK